MNWLRSILLPVQGTDYAARMDNLFLFILLVTTFFFLLVLGLVLYFILRYRRRGPGEITPHITHNLKLEVIWTVVPLLIVMVIFVWGFSGYMDVNVAPAGALEIQVTAKQWVWQFEYPNGTRTINEIHVPVGKPVKLVMSSEDVIHGFYVPSFRIKADVLPNRYTALWFTPTREGVHLLMCTQYCGKGHSQMAGKIYVDTDAKYQDWLENGDQSTKSMPLKDLGAQLYATRGCIACHSLDGTRGQGPSFKDIWGETHEMSDGKSVLVDENYVRESILVPGAKVRLGFKNIMPTFQGVLRDREIQALIEFIKSQK
jgi:cytochrome c oxidase subunit 2